MMTLKIPCFVLIFFMTVIISLVAEENSFASDDSRDYTIFFSGNVVGELDACG